MSKEQVERFLQTIYFGDRGCQGYSLDSSGNKFKIYVDEISRIRSESGNWEYYNDENIERGAIVFSGVIAVHLSNGGYIPNDYIELGAVEAMEPPTAGHVKIRVELGCGVEPSLVVPSIVDIVCHDVYLESPERPGEEIR